MNLCNVGSYYGCNWSDFDESIRQKLIEKDFEENDLLDHETVEEYGLWDSVVDSFYSERKAISVLENYIGKANHYLVVAYNCRWDGASGYMIADDVLKTIQRDYDAIIEPLRSDGKTLICRESSHDVPTGAETVITRLTDREYLKVKDADWEEVEEFINERRQNGN